MFLLDKRDLLLMEVDNIHGLPIVSETGIQHMSA